MKRLFLLTICIGLMAGCTVVPAFEKSPRRLADAPMQIVAPSASSTLAPANIQLVDEGWSDSLAAECTPNGDCSTPEQGYYYRVYEAADYPCGEQGNHEFMVIDSDQDAAAPRNLYVKFLGGGVGFQYLDAQGQPAYWPDASGAGVLTAQQNRKMFLRAGLSLEHGQGVTERFRQTPGWRMVIVSYCSHDLYHGEGEFTEPETNPRWGYTAAVQAVNFVKDNYVTTGLVTYGGSAGAAGAFYVGKAVDADAIIMDSQAVDLLAMRDACNAGTNVFGNAYPCSVEGRNAYDILAERIGFAMGIDEPYLNLEGAPPVYLIWNEFDASRNASLQYVNLHEALLAKGPPNVAQKVCIDNPDIPGRCNLHVPSGKDLPETDWLVMDVYDWALAQVDFSAAVMPEASDTAKPGTTEQAKSEATMISKITTTATVKIIPSATIKKAATATAQAKATTEVKPTQTVTVKKIPTVPEVPEPTASSSMPAWGSMLLPSWEGDRITAFDVLMTAENLGLDGMVATGAPSEENALRYKALDGWIRVFLRGQFDQLQNIDAAARQMGVPYTHIGYGPESPHQAGDEALDPLTWVPKAEALAESWGKGLVYGPAVMDWELRIAPNVQERAALITQVAPHVDIWIVQLGNYERWARAGKDDEGNPFTWTMLYERVGWWVSTIKRGNPAADVWVQAGIGRTEGGICLPPQPVSEFLEYRARLGAVGVDGLFVMPSQTCQLSTDPADHEAWLQAYEAFEQAIILSAQ